jgi:hypothetical protein
MKYVILIGNVLPVSPYKGIYFHSSSAVHKQVSLAKFMFAEGTDDETGVLVC